MTRSGDDDIAYGGNVSALVCGAVVGCQCWGWSYVGEVLDLVDRVLVAGSPPLPISPATIVSAPQPTVTEGFEFRSYPARFAEWGLAESVDWESLMRPLKRRVNG